MLRLWYQAATSHRALASGQAKAQHPQEVEVGAVERDRADRLRRLKPLLDTSGILVRTASGALSSKRIIVQPPAIFKGCDPCGAYLEVKKISDKVSRCAAVWTSDSASHRNRSSKAFASFRSFVSKPSVHQV